MGGPLVSDVPVSLRDLQLMLLDRSVEVDHTTILRWIQAYAREIGKPIRPHAQASPKEAQARCRRSAGTFPHGLPDFRIRRPGAAASPGRRFRPNRTRP
jgi:hypothetical protein